MLNSFFVVFDSLCFLRHWLTLSFEFSPSRSIAVCTFACMHGCMCAYPSFDIPLFVSSIYVSYIAYMPHFSMCVIVWSQSVMCCCIHVMCICAHNQITTTSVLVLSLSFVDCRWLLLYARYIPLFVSVAVVFFLFNAGIEQLFARELLQFSFVLCLDFDAHTYTGDQRRYTHNFAHLSYLFVCFFLIHNIEPQKKNSMKNCVRQILLI